MDELQIEQRFGRMAPTLAVTDIAAAVAFYVSVFGMRVTFENGNPVGFVILRRDQAELHLTRVEGHRGGRSNVAHLLVADAASLHDHCIRQGAKIIKGLRDHEYGLRAFVVADPDGNRIDVGQDLDAPRRPGADSR